MSRIPLTTLKTALLAPIPMAMVRTVTAVNIGDRKRRLMTWRNSVAMGICKVNTPEGRESSQILWG